jgi:predicted transcriptional regulator
LEEKMDSQNKLGKELRRCRKSCGITQQELATAAGVSQSAIAHFEKGFFEFSTDSMERVGMALLRLIERRATAAAAATVSYRRSLSSVEMMAEA